MSNNRAATYEVIQGTRIQPGAVLKSFSGAYKCGGPATACLRWFYAASRKPNAPAMFFRKVSV